MALETVKRKLVELTPLQGAGLFGGSLAATSGVLPALGTCPFCAMGMPACPICAVGALPVVGGLVTATLGAFGLDARRGSDGGCECGDACACVRE